MKEKPIIGGQTTILAEPIRGVAVAEEPAAEEETKEEAGEQKK